MEDSKKITRLRRSDELKAQVLSECEQPGVSVASVPTMSYGINANIVHKWRRLAAAGPLPVAPFVPVGLPAPTGAAPADSLGRWSALTRYIDDDGTARRQQLGREPVRPIAIGRNN